MNIEWVRELCLSFPHATEKISWGHDIMFGVNEKVFAVPVLEPAPVWLCFKCAPETFAELTERMGIIPAPYMARAKWVALETKEALAHDAGRNKPVRGRAGEMPAPPAKRKPLGKQSKRGRRS